MKRHLKQEVMRAVEKIKKLDERGRVQFIILYGSAAGGRVSKLSDIDLAVGHYGSEKERFDFRVRALGELSDRFDVQIFQDLPIYVRKEALRGKVLFYRGYRRLFDEFLETIREYGDFEKRLDIYYSSLEGAEIEETG